MKDRFIYQPHTADIKVLLEATTVEGLFVQGVHAINDILKPGFCREVSLGTQRQSIAITSPDLTLLLIDFLSDVLTESLSNKVIYCDVKGIHLNNNSIKAEITGSNITSFDEEIKAVTYHEAQIVRQSNGMYSSLVLFDI